MKTSQRGKDAIIAEESFRAFAYPDPYSPLAKATRKIRWGFKPASDILPTLEPAVRKLSGSPWTCGMGQTQGVTPDTTMTMAQALADLDASLPKYESLVNSACATQTTQGQFDALIILAWNCPSAVSQSSSIIKAHNRGDYRAAAKAFELYIKSRGEDSPVLLERRKREASMYLSASPFPDRADTCPDSIAHMPPQTVDAERPLTRSKINIASATAGISATLASVQPVVDAINAFKSGVEGLGPWVIPIALVAIVALSGFVIWQRVDMRRRGIV